jgi:hypothetical protein
MNGVVVVSVCCAANIMLLFAMLIDVMLLFAKACFARSACSIEDRAPNKFLKQ